MWEEVGQAFSHFFVSSKTIMKRLFGLIALAALSATSASSPYHSPPASGKLPFPRVYTANIPLPGNTTRGEHASSLAAEVDLLTVIEKTNGTATISFIVHDAGQLKYIQALARLPTMNVRHMQLNPKLTSDLKRQQRSILDGESRQRSRSSYSTIPGFSCYKDLQGTFDWMNAMVARAKTIPGLSVTVKDIGDSFLKTGDANAGHDIWALKITGEGASNSTTPKGVFFVMTGIHAREYAPPELASRWGEVLIDSYGSDGDMTAMLDHTEIHLVLQSNPDGRQVAETDPSTFRRKNLNANGSESTCGDSFGVDLNRNFPFAWGLSTGSSADKCSDTYRGTAPASEPEVKAIVEYCKSIFPESQRKADPEAQKEAAYDVDTTMGIFIDIHSFSELIIWPW
jgi:Zinc carboxypeptidase